jgi:hypothetical protein
MILGGRKQICQSMWRKGHSIAEAVSRWLPTAAARVRTRFWQVGFVVDKVTSGQVFSEYFSFPCQNHSFHQLFHHHYHHYHNFKYKRKIEVPPVEEGPHVTPFKGEKGSRASKLAQRNVDF